METVAFERLPARSQQSGQRSTTPAKGAYGFTPCTSREVTPSRRTGSAPRSGSANRNVERDPSRPTSRRRQRRQDAEMSHFGLDFAEKEDRIIAILERDDGFGGNRNPHAPNTLLTFSWKSVISEMFKPENIESLQSFLACRRPHADSASIASNVNQQRHRHHQAKLEKSGGIEDQHLLQHLQAEDRWHSIDKKTRNALLRSFSMSDYAIRRLFVMEKYIQHFLRTGQVYTGFDQAYEEDDTRDAVSELVDVLDDLLEEPPYLNSEENLVFPMKDFAFHRLLFHGLSKFHGAKSQVRSSILCTCCPREF